MKFVSILITVLFSSMAFAQIMRPSEQSGGTPSRGSNYNDHTTVGQPTKPTQTTKPTPRPVSRGRGCNFSCRNMNVRLDIQAVQSTPTGILLNTSWKKKLHSFAVKNVIHPSWGYSHSERDYQMTMKIAEAEGIIIDEEVLFAASFLHDLGGLKDFEVEGVDHGVRSAELADSLLKSFGFPEEKIEAVKTLIIGHVYSQVKPDSDFARAFRDADMIDFLGSLGVARILAATNELASVGSISQSIEVVKSLKGQLAEKFSFETSKDISQKRIKEMDYLLKQLYSESYAGQAY